MKQILLAWKNVLRNRRRSAVTIMIAAVGCCAILVASGFALYTYNILSEGAAREYGHLTIADKRFLERDEETPMQFGMADYRELTGRLEKNGEVRHVLPRIVFSGLVSNSDKSLIFLGTGADVAAESDVRGPFLKLLQGSVKRPEKGALPYVLLGIDLANSLAAKPGTGLTLLTTTASTGGINAIDVEVSGIVSSGWAELDKRLVYTDLDAAQRLLMTDRVSSLSVYLDDTERIPEILPKLAAAEPDRGFRPWWEQAFYYKSVKGLYNRIFGLLGIIIALLVLFSVINTLAMSVVERTREIGTLRALGAHPQEIVAQFVREGILIGVVGVLVGDLLAWAIILILPYMGLEMPAPPGRSEGYPLLVAASVPLYAITNGAIVCLCALAAWSVSRKATTRPIVEALNHV